MSAQLSDLSSRAGWIVRTQLAALSPTRKHTPGIHTPTTGFLPFTGPAGGSITSAWRQARQAGRDHWGPEHLLLGLISQDQSVAVRTLLRLGITPDHVRQVAGSATAQDRPQAGPTPPPQPAEGVIPAVLAEASARRDYHIGTQHLLLALFHADDPAAAQTLDRLGAGEGQVRDALTAVLAESGPDRLGRRGPRQPGKAARLGKLARDLVGDHAAQGVGVPGG
jgi:ATP-dependent Clp protease ATP-binding subunit ClpA